MIDDQKQSEKNLEHAEENPTAMSEQAEQQQAVDSEETLQPEQVEAETTLDDFQPEDGDEETHPSGEEKQSESSEDTDRVIQTLQQEITSLTEQLAQKSEQAGAYKTQYMRNAADFDNFRKRTQKEKEDLELQVKKNTITELLSVVDNFERARLQIKPSNEGEMTIHKSYQSVYKQLVDSLKRIGVSAMRPEGKEFDPNLHEAVFREQTQEYPEGTVIEQLVRGYMLGDRVLRHAMVKVAAAQDPVITSEENASEAEAEDSSET